MYDILYNICNIKYTVFHANLLCWIGYCTALYNLAISCVILSSGVCYLAPNRKGYSKEWGLLFGTE